MSSRHMFLPKMTFLISHLCFIVFQKNNVLNSCQILQSKSNISLTFSLFQN